MPERATSPALRVLLCDDAVAFPMLVEAWLEAADGVRFLGAVSTAADLLGRLPDARPDVVLLDLMLPEGRTSPELVRSVRGLVPGVRVILCSSLPEQLLAEEATRLEVDGWCWKGTTAEHLLAVLTI